MNKYPAYLLFFALYPVLALWSQNIQEVGFGQIVRVAIASLLLSLLLWLACSLILRNRDRAGLVTVVVLIVFFSYGHLYESARGWSFELARHRYLLPLILIVMIAWAFYVIRIKQVGRFTEFFNYFSMILLLAPLYTIVSFGLRSYQSQTAQAAAVVPQTGQGRPDVYYVILDGYGRDDILGEYYGFDNSAFIAYLEARGFYVAKESKSNYRRTMLSLPSSLNMEYIQELVPEADPKSKDFTELFELLRHSRVRKIFAEHGYRFVTVDNDIKTTIADAEVFLSPDLSESFERVELAQQEYSLHLNSFEGLFIETSLAKLWVDWQVKQGKSNLLEVIEVEAPYNRHRAYILFALDSIPEIARMDGDNFVFIHIMAPHPPFVFGPNGEQIRHDRLFTIADGPYSQGSREDYVRGYTGQVTFLNRRLMDVIDALLEHSETAPIIILQGDHGPKGFTDENSESGDYTENFAILNAYYVPDTYRTELYPSISPVNSFRLVSNLLFGTDYPMLEDRSYFSTVARPFEFTDVTGQIK